MNCIAGFHLTATRGLVQGIPAPQQVHDNHDHCNNEQQVNKGAAYMIGKTAQCPKDNQYYGNYI
jgi:hypothetical protein